MLCIVPYTDGFTLHDDCNLAYCKFEICVTVTYTCLILLVEPSIYTALDHYAFIAVTASSSTLDELLKVVQVENDARQQTANETGRILERRLDVCCFCFYYRGFIHFLSSSHCHVLPIQNLS